MMTFLACICGIGVGGLAVALIILVAIVREKGDY